MEDIGDKLRSLGVNIGGLPQSSKQPEDRRTRIEDFVQGRNIKNHLGDTFLVSERYPETMLHGRQILFKEFDQEILLRWAKVDDYSQLMLDDMIFIDTETTGLGIGTGTMAFMVGIGFYRDHEFHLYQYFLRSPDEERAMLMAINELMSCFRLAVSFNGKSFDIPLLNNRYIINGIDSPFQKIRQLDLLHLSRKLWKNRLASRTLGNIEQEILHFTRTEEEVPGWMAPELYYDYLKNGNAEGVAHVFYHNAMDIVTLGALMMYVGNILSAPLCANDLHGLDVIAIGRLYAELGELEKALELFELGMEKELPEAFYLDCLLRQAGIYKQNQHYDLARSSWEKAIELKSVEAYEELAKYYEHQEKDYPKAILHVSQALEIIANMPGKSYKKNELDRSFQHRLERLLTKWQRKKEA